MKNFWLLTALLFVLVFSSCKMVGNLQVEKRLYGKGYYVHVRDKNTVQVTPVNNGSESALNGVAVSSKAEEQSSDVVEKKSSSQIQDSKTIGAFGEIKKVSKQNLSLTKSENKKVASTENKNAHLNSPRKQEPFLPVNDVSQLVMIILALIISPLAVFLKEGANTRFWIDLICWLLGVGVVGFYFYGGGLLLFAIVFAVLIVIDAI